MAGRPGTWPWTKPQRQTQDTETDRHGTEGRRAWRRDKGRMGWERGRQPDGHRETDGQRRQACSGLDPRQARPAGERPDGGAGASGEAHTWGTGHHVGSQDQAWPLTGVGH